MSISQRISVIRGESEIQWSAPRTTVWTPRYPHCTLRTRLPEDCYGYRSSSCPCVGTGWVCASHPEKPLGTCECGSRGTPMRMQRHSVSAANVHRVRRRLSLYGEAPTGISRTAPRERHPRHRARRPALAATMANAAGWAIPPARFGRRRRATVAALECANDASATVDVIFSATHNHLFWSYLGKKTV